VSHISRTVRLAADSLESRTVPAIVTTTQVYRPLDFTLQGSLAIDTVSGTDPFKTTENYTGTLTATGTVEYSSATAGLSGTVSVDGNGRGVSDAGGYTNTFDGTYTFADDNGGWTVLTPYTGNETRVESSTQTTGPGQPVVANGTFNTADYSFRSTWTNTAGDKTVSGQLTGTVYQSGTAATDLSITQLTADERDGKLDVEVTVGVSGQLMRSATNGAAATTLTAYWESEGDSEDAGIDIPLSWNAGKLTAEITGLVVPEWATRLVFKVDAENAVAEAREANNTRSVVVKAVKPEVPGEETPRPDPTPVNFQLATDGTNHVLWIDAFGQTMFRVPTYSAAYKGPINLSTGDINGDGVSDLVVAPGAGGGPHVKYFNGKTGALMGQFLAYEEEYRGGVNIAVGDVNGDKKADIITGTGEGGAPRVMVWDHYTNGGFIQNFFAYEEDFRGGVSVLATDLDGDGIAEVVTGPGNGGAPLIHVYDGKTSQKKWSLFVGEEELRGGAKLSLRDAGFNDLRVVVDTNSPMGSYEFRAGAPEDGETFLVLIPGPEQLGGVAL
jgi:hypothetical protein